MMSDIARARAEIKKRGKKALVETNLEAQVTIGVLAARIAYTLLDAKCGPESSAEEFAAEREALDTYAAAVAADAVEVAQSIVEAG